MEPPGSRPGNVAPPSLEVPLDLHPWGSRSIGRAGRGSGTRRDGVGLLTIGAFAKAARLSPKALRLYDELGLLTPARVDPVGAGADGTAEMRLHDARPGDRYLLCSDGLSAVVPGAEIRRVLAEGGEPEPTVRALVALAHGSGGPDNVSCVVADVVELQRQ
ncbi:MerR family transcriptional regulator [Streptomyces sp. MAR4 CNY-716]